MCWGKPGFGNRRLGIILRAVLPAAGVLLPTISSATTFQWIGGSGNWSTSANWSPSAIPQSNDTAIVTFDDGVSRTINYDYTGAAVTLADLNLGLSNATSGGLIFSMQGNTLSTGTLEVGSGGAATFMQSGGIATVSQALSLGYSAGDSGIYNLSGGTLNAGTLITSANPSGLIWTGGTLHLTGASPFASATGTTFTIGNSQTLSVDNSLNGANLVLNGGTLSMRGLSSGFPSAFQWNSGTLNVQNNLTLPDNSIAGSNIDLIPGQTLGASLLKIGSGSSVAVNGGAVNFIGGVPSIQVFDGGNFTILSGTVTGLLDVDAGLVTQSGGTSSGGLRIGTRFSTFTNATFNMSGGTLSGPIIVGGLVPGVLNFSGGSSTASTLTVGSSSGAAGVLNLSGGILSSGTDYLGTAGTGTLIQVGGAHSTNLLYLGFNTATAGTYSLSAGTLAVSGLEDVGVNGNGTFNQTGGTHTVSGLNSGLYLGSGPLGTGTYNLYAGSLSATVEFVGCRGSGTFNQWGGSNVINPSGIYIGNSAAPGQYNFHGGYVSAPAVTISHGALTVDAGVFNAESIIVSPGGSLVLSGGTVAAISLSIPSLSALAWSSGTLAIKDPRITTAYAPGLDIYSPRILSSNVITVDTGALLSVSGGTVTASTLQVFTGGTFTQTGGSATSNTIINSNSFTQSGGTITAGGIINSGTFNQTGGSFTAEAFFNSGTVALSSSFKIDSIAPLSGTAGALIINGNITANSVTQSATTINGSLMLLSSTAGSSVAPLKLASSGLLDLTSSAIADNYTSVSPADTIRDLIARGYSANQDWSGTTGITSTTAQFDPLHAGAIGYAEASAIATDFGITSFKGIPISGSSNAVLIAYTYFGDSNLDGTVDVNDLAAFLDGIANNLGGWANGDFNYDGKIDLADFRLFMKGYLGSSSDLSMIKNSILGDSELSSTQKNALLAEVPEPSAIVISVLVAPLLTRRRKDRKN